MATTTTQSKASEAIRTWREAAGLTQTELAGRVGCSLTFLGNLERGYVPDHSPTLSRVLDVLEAATESAEPERSDA
jgi:transcriptional regulator with XRE-family HTH domain